MQDNHSLTLLQQADSYDESMDLPRSPGRVLGVLIAVFGGRRRDVNMTLPPLLCTCMDPTTPLLSNHYHPTAGSHIHAKSLLLLIGIVGE